MARKPVTTEEDISFPEPETATGYPQMGNEVQEEEAPEDWQSAIIAKPDDGRTKALAMVAAQFGNFRPVRSILTKVRSVPTIFPQFDFATRVSGLPLERFIVVHGPSNMGKTTFCGGLGLSFIRRGHFCNWVDAEMTTPYTWLEGMFARFGVAIDTPLFNALRPSSYEETVESVRSSLKAITLAKRQKKIPSDTSGIFIVDSLRKLVPENILKKVADGKNGIDGMGGRAAQIKAAMNAAWLDELIPALHESGCSMVVIARESENTEKSGFFDQAWKMTGGKAIEFDSSLIARISRYGYVKQGSSDQAEVIGERHQIAIRKTKIAAKEGKHAVCFFHTSNGKVSPQGFDTSRDLLELAIQFGIVKKASSWLMYDSKRVQGENGFVHLLNNNADVFRKLESEVRDSFSEQDPLMVADTDEEG